MISLGYDSGVAGCRVGVRGLTGRLLAGTAPVLLVALLLGAGPAAALTDDQDQPLLIEADAAELDDVQMISLYLGNVDVQQGSMWIRADEVLVQHRPDRQIERIIAVGNPVRYRQFLDNDPVPIEGEALRTEYDAAREELTLIDQAVLIQGEDRFASDRIVLNRATGRVTAGGSAQGRERVKIRIEPQAGDAGNGAPNGTTAGAKQQPGQAQSAAPTEPLPRPAQPSSQPAPQPVAPPTTDSPFLN